MTSQELNGRTICVLGAGREGISTALYLAQAAPQASVSIADQQELQLTLPPQIRQFTGLYYPATLAAWEIVVVSPGILPATPLLRTARIITTATNIFMGDCRGLVVGVSGSKGKSTTAALLHNIMSTAGKRAFLVGNIGYPALAELSRHNDPDDLFIYELSSYQLSRIEQAPPIAVLTNLFPEHITYHGDLEQYYTDKLRITTLQTPEQLVIANQNSGELLKRIQASPAQKLFYPDMNGAHSENGTIFYGREELVDMQNLQLRGEHNAENILGAVTAAAYLGADLNAIRQGITTFIPLPHRLELVGTVNGITFYNDSLSTTPESTIAALKSVGPVGTIFLGGENRGYDFSGLARMIKQLNIPNAVFFPDSGLVIEEALRELGHGMKSIHTTSMEEAVQFAFDNTAKNHICLLSCASPSYTVFKNYEDRGNQFEHAVMKLKQN